MSDHLTKAKPLPKVSARDLQALLAQRHDRDVYVGECKNGPTVFSEHLLKLDAWAMKRSWKKPWTYGYEIKVSRSDFLSDDKWPTYLPYCHQFYFVTPPNIIQPDEVPADAGLIMSSVNGARLYTKKKAPHRDIEIPAGILQYILMSRATIVRNPVRETTADYWRSWLKIKKENRNLGWDVSEAIREHVRIVERKNEKLSKQIENYEAMAGVCERLNIPSDHYDIEHALKQAADKLKGAFPRGLRFTVDRTIDTLTRFRDEIKEHTEAAKEAREEEQKP